jgi:hypothetical protein
MELAQQDQTDENVRRRSALTPLADAKELMAKYVKGGKKETGILAKWITTLLTNSIGGKIGGKSAGSTNFV